MSKKVKELLSILPGSPIGAIVLEGNVNRAVQAWKRRFKESSLMADLYDHREYTKPSTRRRKVKMNAVYMNRREKK